MAESSPVERILNREPTGAVAKLWEGVEGMYDSIGLMSGDGAEARRLVFGAVVGSGITYLLKPAVSFDKNGPRPWALTSPNAPNKTAMPFWMPGVAFAIFSGFFV